MATPIHLNIPEPCHENWQQMTPNEQGRHCMSCQKTVVDFTLMTDQEIVDHISRATSSVCGRFNNDQLNKTYAEKKRKPSFTFRYAWNMMVATFLLMGHAALAQSKKTERKENIVNDNPKRSNDENEGILGLMRISPVVIPERQVSGQIIKDKAGKAISNATIRVKGTKTMIITNETGHFKFVAAGTKSKVTLEVSARGYTTSEYVIPVDNGKLFKLLLPAEKVNLQSARKKDNQQSVKKRDNLKPARMIFNPEKVDTTFTIIPPPVKAFPHASDINSSDVVLGGVITIRKIHQIEKMQRTIKKWLLTKKNVSVFPNPAIAGNSINILVKLSAMGEYKLELMDASGRVVHVQSIQIVQQEQVINMSTQSSWSKGVYWVRIGNTIDKKVYQGSVLLQ